MLPSPPGLDRQRGQARPPTLSLHCARNDARWSAVTVNGRQREACWQSADGPMQLATDLIGLSKAERALGVVYGLVMERELALGLSGSLRSPSGQNEAEGNA